MSRMKSCARVAAALLLCGPAVVQGQFDAKKYPDLRRLFVADTLPQVWDGHLSPDGKWFVMSAWRAKSPANPQDMGMAIFLGRVGTRETVRLTSDGFMDALPRWFASGDRIAFISNRPARNGAKDQYGMILDIDPRTGAPKGVPRQVTLEPVNHAWPSPDGKGLVVATPAPGGTLKLVPATGGTARTLLSLKGSAGALSFSGDGRSVRYSVYGDPARRTIEELALDPAGAKPVTLATLTGDEYLFHADARFRVKVVNTDSGATFEVRTLAGELVGRVSAPPGTREVGYCGVGCWDRQVVADTGTTYPLHLVSTNGGAIKDVSPPKKDTWVVGWTPDGSRIVSAGGGRLTGGTGNLYVVEVSRLDGSVEKNFPMPANIAQMPDLGLVGNEWGLRIANAGSGAGTAPTISYVAMDVRNGAVRTLSSSVAPRGVQGPGGFGDPSDRFYWAERDGQQLTVYAEAPGATKQALRTFTLPLQSPGGLFVNGKRIVWLDPRGDSTALVIADDPTSPPRTLITFHAKVSEINPRAMAWSHDGRHFAVSHHFTGQSAAVSIVEVPVSGAAPEPRVLTMEGDVLSVTWLPGDNAIITSDQLRGLARISLASGERVELTRNDPLAWMEPLAISPDGKSAAYSVLGKSGGSIIYSLDFRRVIQAYDKKK